MPHGVSSSPKSTTQRLIYEQGIYFLLDMALWKTCESSVGGPYALTKFSLAAQRAFSENPRSS